MTAQDVDALLMGALVGFLAWALWTPHGLSVQVIGSYVAFRVTALVWARVFRG